MLALLSQRHPLAHPLARTQELTHLIYRLAETLCGVEAVKTQRGVITLFDTPMILLDQIGTTGHLDMLDFRSQHLSNGPWVGRMAITHHPLWRLAGRVLGLLKERFGCDPIAGGVLALDIGLDSCHPYGPIYAAKYLE